MNKPIFELTGYEDLDELLEKINNGADINIQDNYGETALIFASVGGHIEICKLLIKNGADINIQNDGGNTALIRAAYHKRTDICKFLLENGADVNIQNNNGNSALMRASYNGSTDICKLLIDNGANVNIKNTYGNTAVEIMKNQGIYKQVEPYKIIGLKYFKEVFKKDAAPYMDIFETTLYSQDLELTDIKANVEMFYSTVVARTKNASVNEDVEL